MTKGLRNVKFAANQMVESLGDVTSGARNSPKGMFFVGKRRPFNGGMKKSTPMPMPKKMSAPQNPFTG